MPVTQQTVENVLILTYRALDAIMLEKHIRILNQEYPQAFKLSHGFYLAAYRAACDSAIININKLYHTNRNELSLQTIISAFPMDDATVKFQKFRKTNRNLIQDIQKFRNQYVAHQDIQPTFNNTIDKNDVETLCVEAKNYLDIILRTHYGVALTHKFNSNDIAQTIKAVLDKE